MDEVISVADFMTVLFAVVSRNLRNIFDFFNFFINHLIEARHRVTHRLLLSLSVDLLVSRWYPIHFYNLTDVLVLKQEI